VMRPRSSSRGCNTNASVAVTVIAASVNIGLDAPEIDGWINLAKILLVTMSKHGGI